MGCGLIDGLLVAGTVTRLEADIRSRAPGYQNKLNVFECVSMCLKLKLFKSISYE